MNASPAFRPRRGRARRCSCRNSIVSTWRFRTAGLKARKFVCTRYSHETDDRTRPAHGKAVYGRGTGVPPVGRGRVRGTYEIARDGLSIARNAQIRLILLSCPLSLESRIQFGALLFDRITG